MVDLRKLILSKDAFPLPNFAALLIQVNHLFIFIMCIFIHDVQRFFNNLTESADLLILINYKLDKL